MMNLYNSLTGKKEALPDTGKKINMFVCGPTVYDEPHMGNIRTFMNYDLAVRYLRSRGYKIFYLQNITDVDDKIIQKSTEENVSWKKIAQRYEKIYKSHLKQLNISSVDKYARATDHIKEIVLQIQKLIEKDNAYLIPEDGWYFDLSTFPEYGKLSGRTALQAEDAVSRIDSSDRKRNRGDFCLWKLASSETAKKASEPTWKTVLGAGRPGWHIEDTAISEHYFGPQYDIHGGGLDLKFPHHEAEIAQQESASGKKPFVRFWMHSGLLLVGGKKMSKSLGNFLTIKKLLEQQSSDSFRLMVFGSHYRSTLDYTPELAETAEKNLMEIRSFMARLKLVEKKNAKAQQVTLSLEKYEERFHAAMEDDFNGPRALGVVFEMMNEINKNIWKLDVISARKLRKWLENLLQSLGFQNLQFKIPSKITKIAQKRELSRVNKQFDQADMLRKELESKGYEVEDTPLGPLVLPLVLSRETKIID